MKTFLTSMLLAGSTLMAMGQQSYIVGSSADVSPTPLGGILLAGGAGDNDDAMTWLVNRANGGDVVVLRAAGTDAYNSYLDGLGSVNSVETIVISSRNQANAGWVETTIRNAEAVFIAGGDQADYVNFWEGTGVEDGLDYLINTKGGAVGGTSAGCAIQGQVYFSAVNGTTRSEDVLANPYNSDATLGNGDFLDHSLLANTITDTHFDNPDRRGRIFGFMARMVADYGMTAKGIGVDEYTAVAIEPNGNARVFGDQNYDDFAYFLKAEGGTPETMQAGSPLSWDNNAQAVKVYKIQGNVSGSNTFNLNTWTGSGGTTEYFYACNGAFLTTGCSSSGGGGGGGSTNYCDSYGDASDEWVRTVEFGGIYNNSGWDDGYGDYTNQSTDVNRGSSVRLYVRPGFAASSYTEDVRAWIDWNQDGDFDDSGERVMDKTSRRGRTVNQSITIPSGAALGDTRMRVTVSYDANPDPCGDIRLGEVEDYTVTVVNTGSRGAVMAQVAPELTLSVYPNPATESVTIDLPHDQGGVVKVMNLMGQKLVVQSVEEGAYQAKLKLNGLASGQYVLLFSDGRTTATQMLQVR
ncbi:MAG TPA: hypothetical protein DCE41_29785 [Cytophagales bacterium]|nr:hypothetical protein [Cytophagales bacterium]